MAPEFSKRRARAGFPPERPHPRRHRAGGLKNAGSPSPVGQAAGLAFEEGDGREEGRCLPHRPRAFRPRMGSESVLRAFPRLELSINEVVFAWTEVTAAPDGSTTPPASRVRTAVMGLK